jgi:hypothetical protein
MLQVLLSTVLKEAIVAVDKKNVSPDNLAAEVQKIIDNDPRLKNALSQEKPYQSGVTYGGAASFLSGIGMLWGMIETGAFDPELAAPAVTAVLAGIYTLYRRWWPGLKPLFAGRS